QYFNSMKTMILNTVVVTDMPEEAIAAPEDLHDTTQRLAELIDWIEQAWEV
ncbi:MAG: hydrogenase expression/formation C-terminal domain-containing protein, partial [Burkholderiaceae bacterium]